MTATIDWLPTLLAAAGREPDPAYPSDGEDLLPVLDGREPVHPRQLFWRYKAQGQRAVRDGDWKYLRINDNEFLFDVVADQRERANLAQRHAGVFSSLKQRFATWNAQMLPITPDVNTHTVEPADQARSLQPGDRRAQVPEQHVSPAPE